MWLVILGVPYTLLLGLVLYATLLSPEAPPTSSENAKLSLHVFLSEVLPGRILGLVAKIFGVGAAHQLDVGMKRIFYGRSRFFVGMYLVVVLFAWGTMFVFGYPHIYTDGGGGHADLWPGHKPIGVVVFLACLGSFHAARHTSPGTVTPRSMARYDSYPYDGVLYEPGRRCQTVPGVFRLARSKYDRATRRHVPRFDHYCSFLDNSVGEENYRHFLLFLGVHAGMLWYGTYVMYRIFRAFYYDISEDKGARFLDRRTGAAITPTASVVLRYLSQRHFALTMLAVLLAVMGVTVGLFLSFHLYIAARGMTTNEWLKWRHYRKWHKRATREYEEAKAAGLPIEGGTEARKQGGYVGQSDDAVVGCTGATPLPMAADGPVVEKENKKDDCNTGAVGDGKADEGKDVRIGKDGTVAPKRHPGPIPKNIYDKGILENFSQVIFPLCMRESRFLNSVKKSKSGRREEAMTKHSKESKRGKAKNRLKSNSLEGIKESNQKKQ